MSEGYIKLYRKRLESGILTNPYLNTFQDWCLLKAAWKPTTVIVGLQKIHLEPGQFIFGRKAAAEALGSSEQRIRTLMHSSKKMGFLTIKTTNKFSIISVVNWHTYQNEEVALNQQINQQLTNNQPTTNHKQEVKELKELRSTPPISPPVQKANGKKVPRPPANVEEVIEYARSRNSPISPRDFFDYFDAADWYDSEGKPVLSWKQKFITHEKMQARMGGGKRESPAYQEVTAESLSFN